MGRTRSRFRAHRRSHKTLGDLQHGLGSRGLPRHLYRTFLVLSLGGIVKNVRVYTSEFGKKRLAEEDKLGPEELRKRDDGSDEHSSEEDLDAEEIDRRAMEKVRRYQVNKLKYYYAVAEFDGAGSANKVYEECDGSEYELSATRFDLRFIPDDMEFDEGPVSTCDAMPDPDSYKPKVFMTSALQQGKVELTWDETDPERLAAMKRAFEKDDDDDDDKEARALIASESEDDEEEKKASEDEDDTNDAIAKYKALLGEISEKEKKKEEEEGNMEVVFGSSSTS